MLSGRFVCHPTPPDPLPNLWSPVGSKTLNLGATATRVSPRNIDGRPCFIASFGGAFVQQQNQNQKTSAKERSSTVLRCASFPGSILRRAGAASRVEMNALQAPLTPLPPSSRARAFLRVSRLRPAAGYARHTLVSRNLWRGGRSAPLLYLLSASHFAQKGAPSHECY